MRDLSFDLVKLHYRRAERAIKRCARLSYAVPTPAINQLRYAGYHVLSAVKAEQVGDKVCYRRHLHCAESHCVRAWLDACDAITCRNLLTIRSFEEKCYPICTIEKFIPNYIEQMGLARRIYSVYKNPKLVQEMSISKRLKMIHDHRRIASFIGELQKLDKAFMVAIEKVKSRTESRLVFGRLVSSATSVVTSIFGILLSAAGLIALDAKVHQWIVVLGWAGVVVFSILLLTNIVLVVSTIVMRRKDSEAHPRWD